MDNSPIELLKNGLGLLREPESLAGPLWDYASELLRWNQKINLTAITDPRQVVCKHLLDSLCVLPEIEGAERFLDLGAGGGIPGIPLALARPQLRGIMVDSVGKKVAFIKSAIAHLKLTGRVGALSVRVEGKPEGEKLEKVDLLISRAFMDVDPWVQLARHYVLPGGRIVAMLGQTPSEESLKTSADSAGLTLVSRREYQLPILGDPRGVAVFRAP